jgi:hypothetical protein
VSGERRLAATFLGDAKRKKAEKIILFFWLTLPNEFFAHPRASEDLMGFKVPRFSGIRKVKGPFPLAIMAEKRYNRLVR